MQSMGEGLGCDRSGWICQSFCQPYLSNAHCAELCFRSGMDTEWSVNYAKEALDTLGGPKSASGTRFSVCWWYCEGGEYLSPSPPWFSCLRGWRPVARQPFEVLSLSLRFNSRMSTLGCLSGCLGGSVERPGHLSKSWTPIVSPRHCLGLLFCTQEREEDSLSLLSGGVRNVFPGKGDPRLGMDNYLRAGFEILRE